MPTSTVHGLVQGMTLLPDDASSDEAERLLVSRLKARDERAFEALVRQQGPRMLAVARRITRHEVEATESVQDAFIAAFRAIDGFAAESRLSTWLHRIVVNAALMRLRSRHRRGEESIEDLLPGFLEDGHQASSSLPWRESAHDAVERDQTREMVRRCIDRLPENYRIVLLLRDIEELDTDETARALGTNANVVKIRLHRARQALRTLLDPHMSSAST